MLAQNCFNWLKSLNISVPVDWVEACLQWIQEEHRNITNPKQLQHKVYQQWLVANVTDFGISVLPENLQSKSKHVLNETVCLQIDKLRDVSQPAYGQLLSIENNDNPNSYVTAETQFTQQNFKQSRMLKLTLTDGVQTIHGIECKPVPKLTLKSPPGTKIRIKGPVTCRRGVIMLKPSNVEVLGGEVDEIISSNNYHAVICQQLGVPYRPNESNNTAPPPPQNNNVTASVPPSAPAQAEVPEDIPMDILDELVNDDDDFEVPVPPKRSVITSNKHHVEVNRKRKLNSTNSTNCQDASSRNSNVHKSSNITPMVKTEVKSMTSANVIVINDSPFKGDTPTSSIRHDGNDTQLNINSYVHCILDDDDDFESDMAVGEEKPIAVDQKQKESYKFLCDIDIEGITNPIEIWTKAVVITLCSKLKHEETGWNIIAKICDGTKTVNAVFSNSVIIKLMGLSENELSKISSQNQTNSTKCKDALINMCEYMKIRIHRNGSNIVFTVTDLKNH